mmetsp:Transcript_77117/g.152855  ORF Transcript_77117/g.152855 Transcript_77117/m.152855 type:complete len:345 (-) Transcript_77117:141-1175(-)|eukprot:CAMPEP_0172814844 /NCGR_PEP_ID=MMETSP1075-20121228/11449_1 /TAXON_ID=2916 /ORGANISM="Ceratium fusus, Strain PA161109" /LENGTH=344 /DNA_ID=CAMNT_0013654665 /DNA_START=61 /DNA_END=1095 /DNA_ORIENTATION=+
MDPQLAAIADAAGVPGPFRIWLEEKAKVVDIQGFAFLASQKNVLDAAKKDGTLITALNEKVAIKQMWLECRKKSKWCESVTFDYDPFKTSGKANHSPQAPGRPPASPWAAPGSPRRPPVGSRPGTPKLDFLYKPTMSMQASIENALLCLPARPPAEHAMQVEPVAMAVATTGCTSEAAARRSRRKTLPAAVAARRQENDGTQNFGEAEWYNIDYDENMPTEIEQLYEANFQTVTLPTNDMAGPILLEGEADRSGELDGERNGTDMLPGMAAPATSQGNQGGAGDLPHHEPEDSDGYPHREPQHKSAGNEVLHDLPDHDADHMSEDIPEFNNEQTIAIIDTVVLG